MAKTIVSRKLTNNQQVSFCPSVEKLDEIDTKMIALAAQKGDPPCALPCMKVNFNSKSSGK